MTMRDDQQDHCLASGQRAHRNDGTERQSDIERAEDGRGHTRQAVGRRLSTRDPDQTERDRDRHDRRQGRVTGERARKIAERRPRDGSTHGSGGRGNRSWRTAGAERGRERGILGSGNQQEDEGDGKNPGRGRPPRGKAYQYKQDTAAQEACH